MAIMEQHYMDSEFGVQEFCDALGMSRSVASKHLNAEAGLPAGQFIRNYRLNTQILYPLLYEDVWGQSQCL